MGSNMGDKKAYLEEAIAKLYKESKITFITQAAWIETKPWGNTEQDTFINGLCVVDSDLEPLALLEILQRLEREAGRERKVKWGPRTLDLDIIWAEECMEDSVLSRGRMENKTRCSDFRKPVYYKDERLEVPHAYFWDRFFVLEPLAEVYPSFVYKEVNIKDRLQELNSQAV